MRDYGQPAYWLGTESGDFTIIDSLLPTTHLNEIDHKLLTEAAYSPLTWAAMDRSQLCFDGARGPIERTDLKRYAGLWGQVALDFALGATPDEVTAHFVQDYVNDALHRMYSHSSDFLIQSFNGPQNAHDKDARDIALQFPFMRAAQEQGYLNTPLPRYVKDGYPEINYDRLEFVMRQAYGMGWWPMETFNTKLRIKELVQKQPDGSLAFTDQRFALIYAVVLGYLGSENWLHPLQRSQLVNQQVELKHRMSSKLFLTTADFLYRKRYGKGRAHPFDGLYDAEFYTDSEHLRIDDDWISRDIDRVSNTIARLGRTRERIRALTGHINAVVRLGDSTCRFIDPLHAFGESDALPIGVTAEPDDIEGSARVWYDAKHSTLVYELPGGMKTRISDPQVIGSTNGRLSGTDAYAEFMAKLAAFSRQGYRLRLHGVSHEIGNRFMGAVAQVEDCYAGALEVNRLPAEDLALVVEWVGRMSMSFHNEDRSIADLQRTAYPYKIMADSRFFSVNKALLHQISNRINS